MARVTRKLQVTSIMENPTPSTKGRKKRKATCPFKSRGRDEVPKTSMGVKRPLQGSSRKKSSPKTPRASIKSKKPRRPTLFGHYHRLNEALNQNGNKPQEDQESVGKPTTSCGHLGSQNFRGSPGTSELSAKSPRSSQREMANYLETKTCDNRVHTC